MATLQIPQLTGQLREHVGRRDTLRVRAAGRLPAVIYGHKKQPVHVNVDPKQVADLLQHHAHVVEVVIGSKTEPCLIKDVQWNHLGSTILHLDLARVDLTEQVTVNVDLELTGDPIGLKESGAFLQHPINEIEVRCLASQIPDRIKVDISVLKAGETLTIADLKLPVGVTATANPDSAIASIHIVTESEEEVAEADGGLAAEPEVIGKKDAEKKSEG